MNRKLSSLFVFLLFVSLSGMLSAQSLTKRQMKKHRKDIQQSVNCSCIIESFDTTYYKGKAQLVIQPAGDRSYNIFDLRNKLLLKVRRVRAWEPNGANFAYTEFINMQNMDSRAYTRQIFLEGKLAQTVIHNKIMVDGIWYEQGWEDFAELNQIPQHHKDLLAQQEATGSKRPVPDDPANSNEMPAKVVLAAGEIYQEGKLIGQYTNSQEELAGKMVTVHKVFRPNGENVAIVKFKEGEKIGIAYIMQSGKEITYSTRDLSQIVSFLRNDGIL